MRCRFALKIETMVFREVGRAIVKELKPRHERGFGFLPYRQQEFLRELTNLNKPKRQLVAARGIC